MAGPTHLPLDAKIEPRDLKQILRGASVKGTRDLNVGVPTMKAIEPELALAGRVSWVGRPELAPVSQQRPFATCLAHALCRLQETLVALHGASMQLDPELFHQCVAGLNCRAGQPRPGKHVELMCEIGAPSLGTGFKPDDPCPNPRPQMSRANGAKLVTTPIAAKQMIAQHAPVVAVISAEKRFALVNDGAIYHDAGGLKNLNHALLLVGFDEDAGCWEVQNSFGTGWGKNGFGRIAYGHCSILQDNQHPVFALA